MLLIIRHRSKNGWRVCKPSIVINIQECGFILEYVFIYSAGKTGYGSSTASPFGNSIVCSSKHLHLYYYTELIYAHWGEYLSCKNTSKWICHSCINHDGWNPHRRIFVAYSLSCRNHKAVRSLMLTSLCMPLYIWFILWKKIYLHCRITRNISDIH